MKHLGRGSSRTMCARLNLLGLNHHFIAISYRGMAIRLGIRYVATYSFIWLKLVAVGVPGATVSLTSMATGICTYWPLEPHDAS